LMKILDFWKNPGLPKGPSCDNGPNTNLPKMEAC
jgi:hypothetical protein